MEINLKNIEEIIFFDKKIQLLLPEFRHFFDQWQLGQHIPGMKALAKRSVLDVLNALDENHIKKLEEYFNESVLVDKIDYKIVAHFDSTIQNEAKDFCNFVAYKEFCIFRNKDKISLSFWR